MREPFARSFDVLVSLSAQHTLLAQLPCVLRRELDATVRLGGEPKSRMQTGAWSVHRGGNPKNLAGIMFRIAWCKVVRLLLAASNRIFVCLRRSVERKGFWHDPVSFLWPHFGVRFPASSVRPNARPPTVGGRAFGHHIETRFRPPFEDPWSPELGLTFGPAFVSSAGTVFGPRFWPFVGLCVGLERGAVSFRNAFLALVCKWIVVPCMYCGRWCLHCALALKTSCERDCDSSRTGKDGGCGSSRIPQNGYLYKVNAALDIILRDWSLKPQSLAVPKKRPQLSNTGYFNQLLAMGGVSFMCKGC